jgi:hypothetical protein
MVIISVVVAASVGFAVTVALAYEVVVVAIDIVVASVEVVASIGFAVTVAPASAVAVIATVIVITSVAVVACMDATTSAHAWKRDVLDCDLR